MLFALLTAAASGLIIAKNRAYYEGLYAVCYRRVGLANEPESTRAYDSDELNRRWIPLWGLMGDGWHRHVAWLGRWRSARGAPRATGMIREDRWKSLCRLAR